MSNNFGQGRKTEKEKRHGPFLGNHPESEEYFHKLRLRLKLGLLAAFLLPLVVLSIYFHITFNSTLKETGKLHLAALAESQKNTIDLFLQERVVNIFSLFHESGFNVSPSQHDMVRYL